MDVTQLDVKRRCARYWVVTKTACERFDGAEVKFQGFFPFRNQSRVNLLAEEEHHLVEACGRIEVYIEGAESVFDCRLFVHVVDELRLSHSSCRSQQDMGLVLDDADKLLCLFLAVAKVSLRNDAGDEERIGHNV